MSSVRFVTYVLGSYPPLSPSRYRALFQVVYPGSGRGKLIWDIGPGVTLPLVAHPWLFSFRPSGPSVPDRCAHKGNRRTLREVVEGWQLIGWKQK